MKRYVNIGAQALLGLIFFVLGANHFIGFLEMPPIEGEGGKLLGAMAATPYFFPVLKIVETFGGALLLTGRRLAPLGLLLLAPVVVQIFLFHVFLDPAGLPLGAVLILLEAYLGFGVYFDRFRGVFNT